MTNVTESELKIFAMLIIFSAITGLIFTLYENSVAPVAPSTSNIDIDAIVVFSIGGMIADLLQLLINIFWIPDNLGDMWIIVALVKIPISALEFIIGLRIVKDLATRWV